MKKLLLLILILLSNICIAQSRVGSTEEEIKAEFWTDKYKAMSSYTDNKTYYISVKLERSLVIYYFTEKKVCYMTAIFPDTDGDLNAYVEYYNKQYVIISPTRWKMYNNNGFCNIELTYLEKSPPCFIWKD